MASENTIRIIAWSAQFGWRIVDVGMIEYLNWKTKVMVDEKYAWNWDGGWGITAITMSWIWPREYVLEAGTELSNSLKTCLACVYVHHMQPLIHLWARMCKLTNN